MLSRALIPPWFLQARRAFLEWVDLVAKYRDRIEVIVGGTAIACGGIVTILRVFGVGNFLLLILGIGAIVGGAVAVALGLRSSSTRSEPSPPPSHAPAASQTPAPRPAPLMQPQPDYAAVTAEHAAARRRFTRIQLDRIERDEDQSYWRDQILSRGYDVYSKVEGYADFEIDDSARETVRIYVRMARGRIKGKFNFLVHRLVPEDEEDRVLVEGSRTELLDVVRSYLRIFD